jgi:hypothetical protein
MYGNQQQLMFLQALLHTKNDNFGKSLTVSLIEPHEQIPFKVEVYPNTVGEFLAFRVHNSAGTGLWSTWDSEEDIGHWFRNAGLIRR